MGLIRQTWSDDVEKGRGENAWGDCVKTPPRLSSTPFLHVVPQRFTATVFEL